MLPRHVCDLQLFSGPSFAETLKTYTFAIPNGAPSPKNGWDECKTETQRSGRAVYCTGLENRRPFTGSGGPNPSSSADPDSYRDQ